MSLLWLKWYWNDERTVGGLYTATLFQTFTIKTLSSFFLHSLYAITGIRFIYQKKKINKFKLTSSALDIWSLTANHPAIVTRIIMDSNIIMLL